MVQSVGWDDLAFDESEVGGNDCAFGFEDDDGMSDWVETIFVGPRVERADVDVADDLPILDHVIQFDGIGVSTEKRISGLEPEHESERVDEVAHGLILLLATFPFAFPHDDEAVALGEDGVVLGEGGLVDVTHGQVTHSATRLVTVRKTLGASVPETAVKFVDGARVHRIVMIKQQQFTRILQRLQGRYRPAAFGLDQLANLVIVTVQALHLVK